MVLPIESTGSVVRESVEIGFETMERKNTRCILSSLRRNII